MDSISWDIRYGLSEQAYKQYLGFVNRWLRLGKRVYVDPFAIDVPLEKIELVYVGRAEVERRVYGQGYTIVLGAPGSGKTMLWRRLYRGAEDLCRDINFLRASPDLLTARCLEQHKAYKRSKILVDGLEHLSDQSLAGLVQTTQQLYTTTSGVLDFTVFADLERKDLIESLDCVKQGKVSVYNLPLWQEDELEDLLARRLAAWQPDLTDYENLGYWMRSKAAIPGDILFRLRKQLERCGPFDNESYLKAMFVDARIALWQGELPEASGTKARINNTISCLWRHENIRNENALVLLLYVLSEAVHPNDKCHDELIRLADDLETIRRPPQSLSTDTDYTSDWSMTIPNLKSTEARLKFIPTIIEGAMHAGFGHGNPDAPTHALKLARGLVAACAGCWAERYSPPLDMQHIQSIVDIYWGEGGNE